MNHTTNNEYRILLTGQPAPENGSSCWRATVLGLPELTAEACSRAEALEQIQRRLAEFLCQAEVITISVPTAAALNGAGQLAALGWDDYGFFADDPAALKLFDEIEVARNQHLVEPAQV